MASVRFELSKKETDRPELRVWLRYGIPQRRLSCRTGLYGFRDHWSDKKQTHTVKLVNPLFRPEVIEVNEKLAKLRARIETAAANTPDEAICRPWLAEIVEDELHPRRRRKTPRTRQIH